MIFRIRRMALASAVLCLAAATAVASPSEPQRRGYFISIDGLNPSLLETLKAEGRLSERHGLGWLMNTAMYAPKTFPIVTTLTAPSHISTITCTPPSRHGITANSLIRGGERINGFTSDFTTEPLWKSASRQGKKTFALAYVGADGRTPERTADFGIAYPSDTITGPSQTLSWDPATLAPAAGWTMPPGKAIVTDLREATFKITLNPTTSENVTVNALIDLTPAAPVVTFDSDKDLSNGYFGRVAFGSADVVDLFFIESADASTVKGVKRRAFARLLPIGADAKLEVYVSKPSYNNAYPASFRQQLDDANLVWPDYGVRSSKLASMESLEAQAMIDRFLTDVAVRFTPVLGADVVLFYQPLIDSIEHKYLSALPMPFDPSANDDVTKAFVRAFEIIDQNMSRLLADVRSRDVVALMGDHGMDPAKKVVNLAALVSADQQAGIDVVTSGALAMVYAPATDSSPAAAAAADALGQQLRDALAGVSFDGKAALGESAQKSVSGPRNPRRFGDEWHYGDALWGMTAGSSFYFTYNPLSPDVLVDASALGMHGQAISLDNMATAMFIKGPGVRRGRIGEASLIDAVPTFSHLMGIAPPRDCLGTSLVR